MTALGILVLNMDQEKDYFSKLGACSTLLQVTVYRFMPSFIDPRTELVNGEKYCVKEQKWIKEAFPLPTFLYDRCFYSNEKIFKYNYPIVHWLKSHPKVSFLGYGLPNKWKVYNALKEDEQLFPYLPKTTQVTSGLDVLNNLNRNEPVILKPASGSQGKGIVALFQTENDEILIQTQRNLKQIKKTFKHKKECERWLNHLITSTNYLLQPFCSIQDQNNCPFDIRILIQKNEQGRWVEQGRGIRIGKQNHIISNLHGGGKTLSYQNWIKQLLPDQQRDLEFHLLKLMALIPNRLETSFGRLFEIGLDISLDQDGRLWLLEANSKPGRKVIVHTQKYVDQLYEAPLRYCKYLENTLRS
ncbi:YheC/YheD family protein [Anaerobacillus sp. MEB173]|uniref:YheC/YheD family endospore coat-associated protein n=1 Tax=Anaerobacillus sp. MEB173 TaxID=3383345 RepID=UPI003F92F680